MTTEHKKSASSHSSLSPAPSQLPHLYEMTISYPGAAPKSIKVLSWNIDLVSRADTAAAEKIFMATFKHEKPDMIALPPLHWLPADFQKKILALEGYAALPNAIGQNALQRKVKALAKYKFLSHPPQTGSQMLDFVQHKKVQW